MGGIGFEWQLIASLDHDAQPRRSLVFISCRIENNSCVLTRQPGSDGLGRLKPVASLALISSISEGVGLYSSIINLAIEHWIVFPSSVKSGPFGGTENASQQKEAGVGVRVSDPGVQLYEEAGGILVVDEKLNASVDGAAMKDVVC